MPELTQGQILQAIEVLKEDDDYLSPADETVAEQLRNAIEQEDHPYVKEALLQAYRKHMGSDEPWFDTSDKLPTKKEIKKEWSNYFRLWMQKDDTEEDFQNREKFRDEYFLDPVFKPENTVNEIRNLNPEVFKILKDSYEKAGGIGTFEEMLDLFPTIANKIIEEAERRQEIKRRTKEVTGEERYNQPRSLGNGGFVDKAIAGGRRYI